MAATLHWLPVAAEYPPLFIFARPLLPVAAAMSVALLVLWLERRCSVQEVAPEANTPLQTDARPEMRSVPAKLQLTKL